MQISDSVEPVPNDDENSPSLETVRGKCITQLLLLGALDSIQVSATIFLHDYMVQCNITKPHLNLGHKLMQYV